MSKLRGLHSLVLVVVIGMALMGSAGPVRAELIYEYVAGVTPDDGSNATWEPTVNQSALNGANVDRDWSLTGQTFNADAGSSYPGIVSSYSFTGSGSGGTTGQYGRDQLPLGGTSSDAAGASATFEMWVKPNRATLGDIGNETLFESGGNTSGAALIFRDAAGGADLRFRTRYGNQDATNATVTASLTDDALLGDFMQVVGVVDPAGGAEQMRLYVNGQKVGASTGYKAWQDGNNGSGLARTNSALGGSQTGDGGVFSGDVAILRIHDEPMSDAEVQASWTAVTGPAGPPALPTPAAMWDFEDNKTDVDNGVAGAVADKSGNLRHGTAIGDATLVADVPPALSAVGRSTMSLQLDGSGDQVDITGYKGVTGTDARTLSAWVKLEDDTAQQNRSILSWGNNSGGQKWNFRAQNSNGTDGAIRVEVNGGYIVGSTDITDGLWHHVAATWEDDGSPNVTDVLLYVDGALETISAQQGRAISTASGKDVQIGRDHNNRRWKGWLDDVQIFDEALSASQIQALANPVSDAEVPEPATMGLLGLAACGLGGYLRRRREA